MNRNILDGFIDSAEEKGKVDRNKDRITEKSNAFTLSEKTPSNTNISNALNRKLESAEKKWLYSSKHEKNIGRD